MKRTLLTRLRRCFTLIELLVAMAVFSVLMLTMFELFSQVQGIWTTTRARIEVYDKARLFLDIVSRDLEAYVAPSTAGFQFYAQYLDKSSAEKLCTEKFIFAGSTRLKANSSVVSKISEIEFFFDKTKGKVFYRLIGDDQRNQGSAGWNFLSNSPTPENPFENGDAKIWNPQTGGDAAGQYVELIDCVTNFKMIPYSLEYNGKHAEPLPIPRFKPMIIGLESGIEKEYYTDKNGSKKEIVYQMPDFVRVEITVMDRPSWKLYERLKETNAEKAQDIYNLNTRRFLRVVSIAASKNPLDVTRQFSESGK